MTRIILSDPADDAKPQEQHRNITEIFGDILAVYQAKLTLA